MNIKYFSLQHLDNLALEAASSLRSRQHNNIHDSFSEPCQRLFNAIGADSYIRPHRHATDPKTECLIAVRGLMALILFDKIGHITEIVHFGTEKYCDTHSVGVGVEVSPGIWHTVIAITPAAILFEVKAGPFDPVQAKEMAPWAPEEGHAKAQDYLSDLQSAAEKVRVWSK